MRNRDVNDLFNNNALLNPFLRRSHNHLIRVSSVHSETRSCGITLTIHWHVNDLFDWAVSTLVSLIMFSASSSVSFPPTFFYMCRTTSHGSSPWQTTRCSRSCQSCRSAPAAPRQSSAPAGWSSTLSVVTGPATMFVGRHVCCVVWVLRHSVSPRPLGRYGTLGPLRRKAGGGPTPKPQKGKSRCNDASPRQHNTHVFRQNKKMFLSRAPKSKNWKVKAINLCSAGSYRILNL